MKKRLFLLMMVMSLVATGCGGAREEGDVADVSTEQEMIEGVSDELTTEEVVVEEEVTEELQEDIIQESQCDTQVENVQSVEDDTTTREENVNKVDKTQQTTDVKPQTPSRQEPVISESVLENADHPFFEVFFVEHRYKYDGEYYYWGFYMPYKCDTDNCPEYDEAYAEVMSKMKGEVSYVFYGLDGEFADLGEYSFVRMGYKVPTEYMPETLTILYDDNVHWGKAGYIVYYTEEEHGNEEWWKVYEEFVDTYVSYDSEGRMNLYHDTRYFVDGELKCFYVWER